MLVFMKNRLFSIGVFLMAVLVCVAILNFYPQRNYNAIMNPSKAIASTTDDVAEQVLVKSADDVAVGAVASSADDIVGRAIASSTDDIAVSATAGSRQAEKQLLSGSEWNEYFQQTYGTENVQWATKGQSGLTNATKGASGLVRKELPELTDSFKDAFADGSYRLRTFKAGEKVYRSPWTPNELPGEPGSWFNTRQTVTRAGTESSSNVAKWGNPLEKMRSYEFAQDVTVYYGKVEGGTGYQLLIPEGVNPGNVLKFTGEVNLR